MYYATAAQTGTVVETGVAVEVVVPDSRDGVAAACVAWQHVGDPFATQATTGIERATAKRKQQHERADAVQRAEREHFPCRMDIHCNASLASE